MTKNRSQINEIVTWKELLKMKINVSQEEKLNESLFNQTDFWLNTLLQVSSKTKSRIRLTKYHH